MPADDHDEPETTRRRFSVDDARARAREAIAKSEHILSRAYGLFSNPKAEWEQIRAEETTTPNILIGYVAPLAAIPPVCDLIGSALFGRLLQAQPGDAIVRAFVYWVVSVALVFLLGLLINALADNFDGDRDDLSAHKIAAYSLTPAFLSGVFSLWPPLWWLSLFALGAMVFLMYRGLPILMKAPEDRALSYAATVTVAAMLGFILLFSLASCVT
ncbi:MAG: Yip1 family protein [Hyphomonadaceae bacterium]